MIRTNIRGGKYSNIFEYPNIRHTMDCNNCFVQGDLSEQIQIQIQIQLQIQIQIQIFEDCNNYFVQGDLSEQIHLNQLPEESDDQPLVKYSLKQEMRI